MGTPARCRLPDRIVQGNSRPGLPPDQFLVQADANQLQKFARYEATQDRIFRHALADLLKLQKARDLREIGFEREKRAQAEETRKAERHTARMASENSRKQYQDVRKQREEIKLAEALTRGLPPNFDPSSLPSLLCQTSGPDDHGLSPANFRY